MTMTVNSKNKRICFMCKTQLSSRARPTVYEAVEWPRWGAPDTLYLCAKCAKENAPTLKTLMDDFEQALLKEHLNSGDDKNDR